MFEVQNTTLLQTLVALIDTTKENAIRSVDFHRVQLY